MQIGTDSPQLHVIYGDHVKAPSSGFPMMAVPTHKTSKCPWSAIPEIDGLVHNKCNLSVKWCSSVFNAQTIEDHTVWSGYDAVHLCPNTDNRHPIDH